MGSKGQRSERFVRSCDRLRRAEGEGRGVHVMQWNG